MISPPPSYFNGERLYRKRPQPWSTKGIHQGRINGVEFLLIDKSSKLFMFASNNGYACIYCSSLNNEVHEHSTVKIESLAM